MGGRSAADFVAFDCKSQEKAAHGHVVYAVQVVSKTASKGLQNGSHCPGNERCGVLIIVLIIIIPFVNIFLQPWQILACQDLFLATLTETLP